MTTNPADKRTEFENAVVDALLHLRAGEVVSYGGLAADTGYPGRARAVGTSSPRTQAHRTGGANAADPDREADPRSS